MILHVANTISEEDGGAPEAVRFYKQILIDNHVAVETFAWNFSGLRERSTPCRFKRKKNQLPILKRVLNLFRCLRRAEIVHLHEVWSPAIFLSLAYLQFNRKKKIIHSPHGSLERWSLAHKSQKKAIPLWVFRKLAKRIDYFFVTAKSESVAVASLIKGANCCEHPFSIHLGAEPHRPIESYEKKTILFLSRLDPKKGVERLIDAFTQINDQSWKLIIAGSASDKNYALSIESLIENSPLRECIKYKGYVENPAPYYLTASFFVLPTFSENFGFVVAQALSSKLPVITTIDTPWEKINSVDAGLVVQNDTLSIKKAMEKLMAEPASRLKTMGENGYTYLAQNYSQKTVSNLVLDLYNRAHSQ